MLQSTIAQSISNDMGIRVIDSDKVCMLEVGDVLLFNVILSCAASLFVSFLLMYMYHHTCVFVDRAYTV